MSIHTGTPASIAPEPSGLLAQTSVTPAFNFVARKPSSKVRAIAAASRATLLDASWAPAFAALNAEVIAALPDHQKHYLKPRQEDDLRAHVDAGMPMLGILTDHNCIIGGALLTYPKIKTDVAGYPLHKVSPDTAIVGSVMLRNVFARCGLSGQMLNLAGETAARDGYSDLIAKICDTNQPSRDTFAKAGFIKTLPPYHDTMGAKPYWASFWTRPAAPALR